MHAIGMSQWLRASSSSLQEDLLRRGCSSRTKHVTHVMSADESEDQPLDIDLFTDKIAVGIAKEKSSGRILKLVDGDVRGIRELSFYETVFHPENGSDYKFMKQFLPPFCGRRVIRGREFLVLEDVSCGGRNVMDIKIGAVTWDHLASDEKIQQEMTKFPFALELGFRLLGFRVTDDSGQLHVLTKAEAKLLSGSGIRKVLDKFLSPDDSQLQRQTRREHFVRQLHQVRDLMSQERRYRFISSSLLFAYGRPDFTADEVVKVTIIDFAHTFRRKHDEEQLDQNYLTGLNSLLKYFDVQPHVEN